MNTIVLKFFEKYNREEYLKTQLFEIIVLYLLPNIILYIIFL